MSKPALVRRTRASATSAITSALRKRLRLFPAVEPRPPSFKDSVSSGFALAKPGTRPKRIPVPTEIAKVLMRTRRSRLTSRNRGTVCAPMLFRRSTPQTASNTPAIPPRSASITLSVSTCLSTRSGPAPSATRMAISRSREDEADATGARICGNPLWLASALKKLHAGSQRVPLDANPATAHMFIVNPLRGGGMANLFSTHPPLEDRIARLESMVYGQPVR